MNFRKSLSFLTFLAGFVLLGKPLLASTWFPLGPFGGDARSIVADPQDSRHLYLGTATGWVFESHDGGSNWLRLAQIAKRNDLVIDHILVDTKKPSRLLVGAWIVDRPDGGMFVSEDNGKNWYEQAEMRGQSVRSLARAPSNPEEIVAGTLQGVYRSLDGGKHWKLISPAGSTELHEVESIAIDPVDPNVIYAGTWHLPWKTMDGGATWKNIKQGIIEDSDVFSIIVDPAQPQVVYASACSGIYKSVNAAGVFKKVQGIPSTARRTRKLTQDPQHLDTVFAGTTEGLYRTMNGGSQWERLTSSNIIINDVYVDPKNSSHVLLATDRGGVLSSEDGGVIFQSSNTGFSARQVTAYAADPRNQASIYVGVVNDKETGGVFQSLDGGIRWEQQSAGLGGRDVFSLFSTNDGTLLAGTGHGIFRLDAGAWIDSSILNAAAPPPPVTHPRKTAAARPAAKRGVKASKTKPKSPPVVAATKPVAPPSKRLDAVIYALVPGENAVYAGTSQGLVRGDVAGKEWTPVTALQMPEARFVAVKKATVLVGGLKRLELSVDEGATWDAVALPADLTQIASIAIDELNNIWVGGREGVYYSTDYGMNWKTLHELFVTEVDNIFADYAQHRVLVTASNSTVVFSAHLPDYKITYWDTGWNLRFARPVADHLIGATLYDGMVVQPRMVDSSLVGGKKAAAK